MVELPAAILGTIEGTPLNGKKILFPSELFSVGLILSNGEYDIVKIRDVNNFNVSGYLEVKVINTTPTSKVFPFASVAISFTKKNGIAASGEATLSQFGWLFAIADSLTDIVTVYFNSVDTTSGNDFESLVLDITMQELIDLINAS